MIRPAHDLYLSRTDRDAAIIARQDPVVYGGGTYAAGASHEQIAAFERDGFLFLEEFFSPQEVAALMREVERMAVDPAIRQREEVIREPGSNDARGRAHGCRPGDTATRGSHPRTRQQCGTFDFSGA